ncbi:HNH endonuclease [Rhodopirellula sp.]|nr:HNH endonuclease [Rhodopirellula sp.]MDB4678703.1 HNH endonuclease [Rhodopirellula sp.]
MFRQAKEFGCGVVYQMTRAEFSETCEEELRRNGSESVVLGRRVFDVLVQSSAFDIHYTRHETRHVAHFSNGDDEICRVVVGTGMQNGVTYSGIWLCKQRGDSRSDWSEQRKELFRNRFGYDACAGTTIINWCINYPERVVELLRWFVCQAVGEERANALTLEIDLSLHAHESNMGAGSSPALENAFILTWNPSKWNEWNFSDIVAKSKSGEIYSDQWSTGNRKEMMPGDRVFLMRQGDHQGLIGSGYTTSGVFQDPHWDGSGKEINTVYIDLDTLVSETEVLTVTDLLQHDLGVKWNNIYASGNSIPSTYIPKIEKLWRKHLTALGRQQDRLPNEVLAPTRYVEGAVKRIFVNSYERSALARKKCIEHWGLDCAVCGFNFKSQYGSFGEGFIHVHHLRDLASIGREYNVDPKEDLRPVCPNCHAMLHRQKKPLSIEELKQRMVNAAEYAPELPAG